MKGDCVAWQLIWLVEGLNGDEARGRWRASFAVGTAHNNSSGRVKSEIDAILGVERMVRCD